MSASAAVQYPDMTSLCGIIGRQVECYARLLVLAQQERQVLSRRDRSALHQLTEQKAQVLSQLSDLEEARRSQVRRLADRLQRKENDLTLGRLSETAGPEQTVSLNRMRQELKRLAADIRRINDANSALVERLREYTHTEIGLYASLRKPVAGYTARAGIVRNQRVLCDGRA